MSKKMIESGKTSEGKSAKSCKPSVSCIRNRWKQLLILAFFAVVILFLIADTIARPCTLVEKEDDRQLRLFCDEVLLAENGTLVPGQLFVCSGPNSTSGFTVSGNQCQQESSCVQVGLTAFIDWISGNVAAGFFATAVVYCIAAVLLVPGSILTIGAGAAFGTALGLGIGVITAALSVWLGASAAALISFLLGKYLLRDFVEALSEKYRVIRAIDSSLGEEGFKITLLLRFSPVVPFSAFNYVMGSTSCSFRNYAAGTLIGIFPGTVAFVFIGAAVAAAATGGSTNGNTELRIENCSAGGTDIVTIIVLVVGVIATFIAVVIIGKYSRKQFQKYLKEDEEGKKIEEEQATQDVERL